MTKAEVLNKPYWEVFPRGSGPMPGCQNEAGNAHTCTKDEVNIRESFFLSDGYVVRDDQGKPLYFMHILSDITVQKQAETVLRHNEEHLRAATENIRDAIITLDGEGGTVTLWNPASEAIFGFSKNEMIGQALHEVIVPSRFREAAHAGMAHFATTGEGGAIGKTLELVALHKNGTEFPIELSLSAMQINGKWLATGIARDISERKRVEEAMRISAIMHRLMFESSLDALMMLAPPSWNFIAANEAALELFGVPSVAEFTALELWDLSPERQPDGHASSEKAREMIETAMLEGSHFFEWEHQRLDGRLFVADVLLTRMNIDEDVFLQATVHDITERKRAEAHIERINRLYRTISHCNVALVRSRDELELTAAMCQVLVEEGGFCAAWVGYAETGGAKRIHPVAAVGIKQAEIVKMKLTWDDNEWGQNPSGTAIRTGKIRVSQDILIDPGWASWHEQAGRLGHAAAAVFPLQINGMLLGALHIYSAEPHVFAPDLLELLTELAGDLAFGIGNLRAHAERMNILEKLEHSLDHAVTAIAATVEMRDPYTAGHQRRVAQLAAAIAVEMGLPEQQVEGLRMAGVVHDIGKIHVPAEILSNPSKLSEAEFEIIKTHCQAGYEILKGIDFPWPVAEIVWQHHEKLDGSGYPRKLKGEEILLEARILTVADIVEAMASHRPYRPGFGIFPSLQEISRNKGKLYDEKVVEACMRIFMERNYEF